MKRSTVVLSVLLSVALGSIAAAIPRSGGPELEGKQISVHLPESVHLRNRGGRDGAGLCVFASISHAGAYQNDPIAESIFQFMFSRPGGGYPEKVDAMFKELAKEKGVSAPKYVQHTGGDADFLRAALAVRRYPCVTYAGRDNVFYRSRVAHMVNLVRLDESAAVIHDNNYPGQYLWMTPDEFLSRWRDMGGGWAVVLLSPPPPPVPTSAPARPELYSVGPALALAQCPDGRCPIPSRPSLASPVPLLPSAHGLPAVNIATPALRAVDLIPGYWWRVDALDARRLYLYRDGRQVGTYSPDRGAYLPLDAAGRFGDPVEPPVPLPGVGKLGEFFEQTSAEIELPTGVVEEKIPRQVRYEMNGQELARDRVRAAIGSAGGGGVPNDGGRLAVTVVGDAAMCKRVVTDFETGELSTLRDSVHLQTYAPDHWMVRAIGLSPGVTIQAAPDDSGRAVVLARLREYGDGDAGVLAQEIRRRDPNYRPDKDSDPKRKPTPEPEPAPAPNAPLLAPIANNWQAILSAILAALGVGYRDQIIRLIAGLLAWRRSRRTTEEEEEFQRWRDRRKKEDNPSA